MAIERDTTTSRAGGSGVDALLERIGGQLGPTVKASTVFGDPVERDGLTIIPVARAAWGFGGSAASGHETNRPARGGGGGGGMSMSPVGYIEMANGRAEFRPVRQPGSPLPYVVGAVALVLLAVRMLGRRPRAGRVSWKGLWR
jgi:uncharacterized spore protein YtfJ